MNKRLTFILLILLVVLSWIAWRASSTSDAVAIDVSTRGTGADPRSESLPLVAPQEAQRVEVTPSPAKPAGRARLIVRCVDPLTGELVNGVDIEVKPQSSSIASDAKAPSSTVRSSTGVVWIDGEEDLDVPAGVPLNVIGRSRTRAFQEAFQAVEALEPGARHKITLEIALPAKVTMHVHIVDQETGLGVAKARIERSYFEQPDLESDVTGRVVVRFAEHRSYSNSTSRSDPLPEGFCRVHAQGYGSAEFRESSGHEREDIALELRLTRSATLVVSLVNPPDTRAKAYNSIATVSVGALEQNASTTTLDYDYGELKFQSVSDLDGRMRIDGLPANVPIEVLLSHGSEPLRRQQVQLRPGEERALTIDLGSPCHLRGRIVDSAGSGAADLEVWLKPSRTGQGFGNSSDAVAKTRSDGAGNFDMGQVRVGGFWLVLAPIPYTQRDKENSVGIASSPLALEILPGETEKEVELHVARGLFVRGKVVRADGSAKDVGGVSISANSKQRHGARTTTLFDGTFIAGPLLEGTYTFSILEDQVFGGSLPVEVAAGSTDVVLVLLEAASLSGRVVESAGGPGVRAMLLRTYADGAGTTSTQNTAEDGAFRYSGLRPSRMSLTAYSADGRIGVLPALQLSPGEHREIEVLLSPGAKVRLKVTNAASLGSVQIFQDDVLVALPDVETLATANITVPVGALTVRTSLDGASCVKNVSVSVGEQLVLELP